MKAIIYLFLALGLSACCTNTYEITGEGSMRAWKADDQNEFPISNINGPFKLSAEYFVLVTLGPSPESHTQLATTCGWEFNNEIDSNSIQITTDKIIVYKGDTLLPGTNLATIPTIEREIYQLPGATIFTFTDSFYQNAVFKKAEYQFEFSARSNDGVEVVLGKPLMFD